jgi:hypothetical protein
MSAVNAGAIPYITKAQGAVVYYDGALRHL